MRQPENSTVLDSGRRPQHDGIFAFGCIILVVDTGERGSPAAQLRHAGVRLAVVIAAGATSTTTAAMSAAATTTAATIAAEEQHHSTNTSRIASVRARVGERARSS